MSEFLALLSHWRGRSFVQRELESRGFVVPTRYQQLVATYCSPDSRRDLDHYWDEAAREYICSAGQVNSTTRAFPDVPCYRSKYLDDLASTKNPSPVPKVRRLHPCLDEFEIRRRSNPEVDLRMIEGLQAQKRSEIRRHG